MALRREAGRAAVRSIPVESGLTGGAWRAPAGAQRADPLSPMAAREHPWAVPRRVPRGARNQVVIHRRHAHRCNSYNEPRPLRLRRHHHLERQLDAVHAHGRSSSPDTNGDGGSESGRRRLSTGDDFGEPLPGRQRPALGFSGEPAGAIRQLGAQYAATVLPGTLQTRALERIDWHKSQGDDIVVVSASLDLYLTPWCAERGLKVICTTIEEQRGTLTGRYVDGDCSGA